MRTLGLSTVLFATVFVARVQGTDSQHKITVTFDYDFTQTPVCSPGIAKACVHQFNLYDISAGITKRAKLMSFRPRRTPVSSSRNYRDDVAPTI